MGDSDSSASQTTREQAELRKLELESAEIERRLSKRWFEGRFVLEGLFGAVVTAGLLAAWLIGYFQPILNRKQEIASLDAVIQTKVNERQRLENEERTAVLELENKGIRDQLAALAAVNTSMQQQQAESERTAVALRERLITREQELGRLAQESAENSAVRQRLTQLSDDARKEADSLQKRIEQLRADQVDTEARGKNINNSITANNLKETVWRRECPTCKENSSKLVFVNLRGDGKFTYSGKGPSDFGNCSRKCVWKVEGNRLILDWNDSFSVETFTFPRPDSAKVEGTKSNVPGAIFLERVRST